MANDYAIHDYEHGQQRHVERFYHDIYTKHKTRQLLAMIVTQGKKSWTIGTGTILATIGIMRKGLVVKLLILWNTVWLIRWYNKLWRVYDTWVQDQTQRCMNQLTGKVWVMTSKARHVIGVAILYKDDMEGQIKVTAQGSRIELALVQTAIRFARQQHVKVVTRAPPEKHPQFLLK